MVGVDSYPDRLSDIVIYNNVIRWTQLSHYWSFGTGTPPISGGPVMSLHIRSLMLIFDGVFMIKLYKLLNKPPNARWNEAP